jgi:hypothetical protein
VPSRTEPRSSSYFLNLTWPDLPSDVLIVSVIVASGGIGFFEDAWRHFTVVEEADHRSRLLALDVPVLVTWAMNDKINQFKFVANQAAKARDDMRSWQVERRKRTRHLIELGGLVVKAGIVDLTDDDRATILGALLWMADRLKSDQSEHARALWTAKGKQAFEADTATHGG